MERFTVGITGMVDVAGFVLEGLAVNIVALIKLENIDVAAVISPLTFFFGNLFPVIPDNTGVFLDVLRGEKSFASNLGSPYPNKNLHSALMVTSAPALPQPPAQF